MTVLADARVVAAGQILDPGWIHIQDGRITGVGPGEPPMSDPDRFVLDGAWVLPGFVDLHVHGGGGHDVAASPADAAAAVAFHLSHGTTRTLLSLVTAPVDVLAEQLSWIADLVGPQVAGAHLEGPFLAHARCGAQNPEHLLAPDLGSLDKLLAAGRGTVRSITIAPELPGALEVIAATVRAGAVAAIGHTDATYEQAMAGFDAGASLATHLFNTMPPLLHREPGAVGASLGSGHPCEVINDGVHVHPSITNLVGGRPGRLVLVTDAIDAAGRADGAYTFGVQSVHVADRQARLVSNGALAGSTLTMDDAFRRAVLDAGLGLVEASAAASGNAARAAGLDGVCGTIAPGLDADLVVLDEDLRLVRVMKSGSWT